MKLDTLILLGDYAPKRPICLSFTHSSPAHCSAPQKPSWFLKQGDAHPLKAIGVVATIIVFGTAMLVKEAWTVL